MVLLGLRGVGLPGLHGLREARAADVGGGGGGGELLAGEEGLGLVEPGAVGAVVGDGLAGEGLGGGVEGQVGVLVVGVGLRRAVDQQLVLRAADAGERDGADRVQRQLPRVAGVALGGPGQELLVVGRGPARAGDRVGALGVLDEREARRALYAVVRRPGGVVDAGADELAGLRVGRLLAEPVGGDPVLNLLAARLRRAGDGERLDAVLDARGRDARVVDRRVDRAGSTGDRRRDGEGRRGGRDAEDAALGGAVQERGHARRTVRARARSRPLVRARTRRRGGAALPRRRPRRRPRPRRAAPR